MWGAIPAVNTNEHRHFLCIWLLAGKRCSLDNYNTQKRRTYIYISLDIGANECKFWLSKRFLKWIGWIGASEFVHLHLPFAVKKRGQKIRISRGLSVNDFQPDWRSDELHGCCVFFFFFFFIDVIFNCLQQRTGELNSKYIFYQVTRQKIRAARGNCKVKRSRWTTLKKKKKIFKEAGIQSNLSVVFRNWETQKLFQPPVVCCRLRRYTHYATDCIQPTVVSMSPKSRLKSTSTQHHQDIWFGSTLYKHSFVFCWRVFAVSEYLRSKWRMGG